MSDEQPRILTAAEIEAGRSAKGGWTRERLAAWGVPWPPPKGWRKALLRGETPAYREDREDRVLRAVAAATLAIDEYYNGDKQWAEEWLLAAGSATRNVTNAKLSE